MSDKVRYKTKYPKIFSCYWGAYDYSNIAMGITDEIIDNRNKFVEDFEITRSKTISDKLNRFLGDYAIYGKYNPYYDHIETYYTKTKKHIIVVSPYLTNECFDFDKIVKYFEKGGFKLYNKIYSTSATTFIKVVNYDSVTRKYS